jgi:hypothetical protein
MCGKGEHGADTIGIQIDVREGIVSDASLRTWQRMQLRECCEAPFVDPGLYVAVTDSFEVNHRRCDVTMSHPLLQGADVDPVLEMARGIRVAEFVEEPTTTEGSLSTAIDIHTTFF